MGLYVEVMCDVRSEERTDRTRLHFRCWSHANNNPQGHSVVEARRAARSQGWVIRGGWACCPGCKDTEAGRAALRKEPSAPVKEG